MTMEDRIIQVVGFLLFVGLSYWWAKKHPKKKGEANEHATVKGKIFHIFESAFASTITIIILGSIILVLIWWLL